MSSNCVGYCKISEISLRFGISSINGSQAVDLLAQIKGQQRQINDMGFIVTAISVPHHSK